MKFKKLVYLLVVLALLAGAVVVKKNTAKKKEKSEQQTATALEYLAPEFDPASVTTLGLRVGESQDAGIVLVKKENGAWGLPGYFNARAKKWVMEQLLKKIAEAKGEVRSDTADVLGDYGLTDEKALHIQASGQQNELLVHFLVGLNRSVPGQNFVRLDGSNRVIVSREDIAMSAGLGGKDAQLDRKYFADMQLVRLETAKVTKIDLSGKGSPWTLIKKEAQGQQVWGWDPPESAGEVDPEKVSTLLNSVAALSAREILDAKTALYRFDAKPWLKITESVDGQTKETSLFWGTTDKEKKSVALRVVPDDVVYEMDETAVDGIKTDKTGFLKPKKYIYELNLPQRRSR